MNGRIQENFCIIGGKAQIMFQSNRRGSASGSVYNVNLGNNILTLIIINCIIWELNYYYNEGGII